VDVALARREALEKTRQNLPHLIVWISCFQTSMALSMPHLRTNTRTSHRADYLPDPEG